MQKLTLLILCSLLSCSESVKVNVIEDAVKNASPVGSTWENTNNARFTVMPYMSGKDTCFAMMNDYFKTFERKVQFPFFMLVSAQTETNNVKGFPEPEEQDIQNRLEDSLIMYFDKHEIPFCFVGHSTRRGFRDMMLYVNDTARAGQAIAMFMSIGTPRKTAVTMVPDSGWMNIQGLYSK